MYHPAIRPTRGREPLGAKLGGPMAAGDHLEVVEARDRGEWRGWLERNGAASPGVWLLIGKKNARLPAVSYEEAVEEALAFGWIDSTTHRHDEDRIRQLFTPRKPTSGWSRSNKRRVERLTREGRMAPAGLAAVEIAKANGSWEALDDVENLVVPADLAAALEADPEAKRRFEAFSDSSRKMTLFWLHSAKRPDTRARRIAQIARMAANGLRAPFDRGE
jgi:uncharacterized protein YdeI (YjbR/CyaY-like superfamily)